MSAGHIYTIGGNQYATAGYAGDGGPATSALLNDPNALTMDPNGDIYISDSNNSRVQEIAATAGTQWGQSMTAGDIYTIAGSATGAHGSSGDGGPAASALLWGAGGLALDSSGDLYIGDGGNNRVQELAATTHAQWGQSMTAGDIYTVTSAPGGGSSGDGGPATAAKIDGAQSLAIDASGDLYIADEQNNRIQEIANVTGTQWGQSMTAGDEYTVAGSATAATGNSGDGGPATAALMANTQSVSIDPEDDLYITDNANDTIREVASGTANAIAPAPGQTSALAIAPGGAAPGGITITQPGGAQVTFWAQAAGACATSYVVSGNYCVLPQDQGATLSYNAGTQAYTFSPAPGSDTYTYQLSGATGTLTGETDTAGNTLTITDSSPAPGGTVTGNGTCPAAAVSCQTITSASGRALILGYSAAADAGQVTSATDPMNRTWTYGYAGQNLTSVTDPLANKTTYTYGTGSGNNNPLLANNLLTITNPNAQPGGPDAGDSTVNTYSNVGQVISQTDPMGWTTVFNYCLNPAVDDCMNSATGTGLVTVTDPDGNRTVYDYAQGTLAGQSDWTGATLTSEIDYVSDQSMTSGDKSAGSQLVTAGEDGNGNLYTTVFDSLGRMTSATMPDPDEGTGTGQQVGVVTQAPTSLGLPACTSDVMSSQTCTGATGPTPVAPGGVISPPSSIPPQGVTWTLYDTYGNPLWVSVGVYPPGSGTPSYAQTTYQLYKGNSVTLNGNDATCSASPPSSTLPCATIDANGVVTQLAYDAQGDLTSSSVPDGNASETATTTYAYDSDGEQTSTVSPDGNVSGANAGNYTTSTVFNNDGKPTSVTQGGGAGHTDTPRGTGYQYDGDGNPTIMTDARGYATTTAYNADDEATLVTDPDNQSTLTCYDGDGHATQTVPPVGVAADSLSPSSCPASYPAGYSTRLAADADVTTYNGVGWETQQTTPAPAGQSGFETATYSYDSDGAVTQLVGPSAVSGQPQVTASVYNSAGELTAQTTGTGSAASTTSYCYDPTGQETAVVLGDGNTSGAAPCETTYPWIVNSSSYPAQAADQTTYAYDSSGELVSETRPGGATTTFSYDPDGNNLTSADPDGITTTKTFNPAGSVLSAAYSGSSAHSVAYAYDAAGQMTSMTDATGTSSFSYDSFGELTVATDGARAAVDYGYDSDGHKTSITYPLGGASWASTSSVTYGYDHAGELNSITDFNGNAIDITRNADGLPTAQTLGATGNTIGTAYDPTDAISAITVKNGTDSTLQSFSYNDSQAGTVMSETDLPVSAYSPVSYTYDNRGRVASMTPGTGAASNYGFDASGNLTTLPAGATGTYSPSGELSSTALSGGTTTYAYNPDGERLSAKEGTTTLATAAWNGAGTLTSYADNGATMSAATYDGNGMRTASTVIPSGGSPESQGYLWDGDDLLMDSTNAYIYVGASAPAEQVNLATGSVTYLITDSLGSVRGTMNSSGAITGTTSYDAWGNPATVGGLTPSTPFGYAGGYTDPTGLIYLINRYYDPSTGQFISVDPAVNQTLAPYSYTDGNPVSQTDPTGEQNICPSPDGCSGGTPPYATGKCANAVPSCRYDWALNATMSEWQNIIDSSEFYKIYAARAKGNLLGALGAFAGEIRAGGPWDMKTHLTQLSETNPPEHGELHTYSRVTATKQIYYNVFGNVLYAGVGLQEGFSKTILEDGATGFNLPGWLKKLFGVGDDTPGNALERAIGYRYGDAGDPYDDGAYFTKYIIPPLNSISRYCDVREFPESDKRWKLDGCGDPANW
jgi:RHS repeat-associated protein